MKRTQGEKLPTNYVKSIIMLFVSDEIKSTIEIKNYLKDNYKISESRGIKKHLSELEEMELLDKEFKNGITNQYFWKKNPTSFRKIITFLEDNIEIIKQILFENLKENRIADLGEKMYLSALLKKPEKSFDITRYWFATQYCKSFFNVEFVESQMEKAFADYRPPENGYKLNKENFKHIVLDNVSFDGIVTMMHHSPSLVRYLLDLQTRHEEKTKDLSQARQIVPLLVMRDMLVEKYPAHAATGFVNTIFVKERKSKVTLPEIEIDPSLILYPPGGGPLAGILKPSKNQPKISEESK